MTDAVEPGLVPTRLRHDGAPYVGAPWRPIARFAEDDELDRLLLALSRGFGPQRWWPAETPFEVVVGAVLTQNTAWRNVELALARLRADAALTPRAILALTAHDLEGLVRPSGTFRVKAEKLRRVSRWYLDVGGLAALRERELGPLREELLGVWGVGPETADSILCYAADRSCAVVDAYTRRLLARHGRLAGDEPYEEVRAWLEERLVPDPLVYQEFHALAVRVGYDHCKPRARCEGCPAEPLLPDARPSRAATERSTLGRRSDPR